MTWLIDYPYVVPTPKAPRRKAIALAAGSQDVSFLSKPVLINFAILLAAFALLFLYLH